MDLEKEVHTGLNFTAPLLSLPLDRSSSNTTDLLHFCAADALSRLIFFYLTVRVLAKCQGP